VKSKSNDYQEVHDHGSQISLRPKEAAELLSLSEDAFRTHVLPCLKTIRVGRLTLVPRSELERWSRENAFLNSGV